MEPAVLRRLEPVSLRNEEFQHFVSIFTSLFSALSTSCYLEEHSNVILLLPNECQGHRKPAPLSIYSPLKKNRVKICKCNKTSTNLAPFRYCLVLFLGMEGLLAQLRREMSADVCCSGPQVCGIPHVVADISSGPFRSAAILGKVLALCPTNCKMDVHFGILSTSVKSLPPNRKCKFYCSFASLSIQPLTFE